jgi:nucleotide-binding universal stress UspA family protein
MIALCQGPDGRTFRGAVLALVEDLEDAAAVVRTSALLAAEGGRPLVLLHTAGVPPESRDGRDLPWADSRLNSWRSRIALEVELNRSLERWAAPIRASGLDVGIEVNFGKAVREIVLLARALSATAVVVASGRRTWLPWRSRERRLLRALSIPVHVADSRNTLSAEYNPQPPLNSGSS